MPVHSAWFNPELVVYRGPEPLLTADVAFRSLHRDMTEKELDLFEFSAGGVAEPRARKQVTESAGINRHIVGDGESPTEKEKRLYSGLESCLRSREG